MNRILISIFLLFQAISAGADNGSLKGTVIDAKTKESLIGTTVMVKETSQGTITDFDGNFLIQKVQPGRYTLLVSFISYDPQELNIEVKSNEETVLNVALSPATLELEGVQVVAKANRESESMLLAEQKNAVIALQSIGAQEMSRKGASNAEAAVTKVSGISKQEGVKNVFVRGLGDRYNSTTLNGFALPSEDPEYKNISLDFFSSDVIKTVDVNKVFSASLTGDVGGAAISVESKELVGKGEFELGISAGANSATIGKDFLSPTGVNKLGYYTPTGAPANQTVANTSYSFKNSLTPKEQTAGINQSYSFAAGHTISEKMSFFATGGYDVDYYYNTGVSRNTNTAGTFTQDFDYEKYERSTRHMLMGNLDYKASKATTLSFNSMYIHTNSEYYGLFEGYSRHFNDAGADQDQGLRIRQQVNDNTLFVTQLIAKYQLSDRLKSDFGTAFNRVLGNEPDRRINNLFYTDFSNGKVAYLGDTGNQQRFDSELSEDDMNFRAGFTYLLREDIDNQSALNFGYYGRLVKRDFEATIFDATIERGASGLVFDYATLRLDDFFSQNGMEKNYFSLSFAQDVYNVSTFTNSPYAGLTYQLADQWIVIGGIRADLVDMTIDYNVNKGQDEGSASIKKTFVLPSINSKYNINEKNAIRLAASKSYTMPQSKEISPFEYQDATFVSKGYADLQPSVNYNIDLKWDFYLSNDELLTVNGFYKIITDPISRVEVAAANSFLSYRNISDKARATGIELEFRKNILKLDRDENSDKVSFGLNASYIKTQVDLPGNITGFVPTNSKSELEGAAPVIVNSDLSYQLRRKNNTFTSSFVFNYSSDKVYTLGTNGFENIIEKGIPTLDLVVGGKFGSNWGFSLKAQNLLDPEYVLEREPSTGGEAIKLSSYKKGVVFSAGLKYTF
ncbi:TonB-dependent receptor [Maribellus sp. YY47]|uniref:TonB-dependent receptor n=1 Tax=Maribellus sp. YY47 TaxID=2929486 RepID=UPI00200182ED|nr:TonB-dependent receptor [Maribellus sp. YY47]MCK3686408.1 carboxypeptidase-like regulatory domain-containing protein [Maribellus sp. YY47]